MIEVEYISPYTIVKKNDLYGIVDRTGNLVVPCVMDEIVNDKDEEVGLETWADFFCVIIVKDGEYGFFTNNGKLIEPAYEFYAIDPCGGDIHVKTDKGYGMFASPDYLFEEIPVQYSLLEELDLDNFDDDLDESFFETGEVYDISLQSWQELGG